MLESAFDEARRSSRNLDEQYQAALAHAWDVLKIAGVYDPRTIPTIPSLSKADKLMLVYKFAQAIRESAAVVPCPDLLTNQLAGEINCRFGRNLEDHIQLEDLILKLPGGLPKYRLPGFEGELQEHLSDIAKPLKTAINRGLGAISRDRDGFQTVGQIRSNTVVVISTLYQVGYEKAEFFRKLFYKP